MENINIRINRQTRMTYISRNVIGNDGENLQENLVFSFEDEFVDGQARLELKMPDKTKSWITLTKVGETYQIPVKSVMTKTGKIDMQLVIDEGTDEENIPIFKSNKFYLTVNTSINAVEEAPDGYAQWLEIANEKLNEIDVAIEETNNLDLDAEKEEDTATITITKKDGTQKSINIYDGRTGADGKDAKINGYNTIELVAGQNIIIEQIGNQLIISARGVAPYPDNHLETSDGDIFMTYDDAYFIVKESD